MITQTWTPAVVYGNDGAKAQAGFGVCDSRGRAVGAELLVWQEGDEWRVLVHATRNGQQFGAYPGDSKASSEDEAKALALTKCEAALRRVQKAASKTGGVYLTASERRRSASARA